MEVDMIDVKESNLYWNYFLALEKDLEVVARYVEFCEDNWDIYSIELVRLLLSVSSEVDVLLKELCKYLNNNADCKNINDYRLIIKNSIPEFIEETVFVNRYGLRFQPWINWRGEENPIWWRSYNNVKHKRSQFFKDANLKNVLNAFGALLITNFFFYKHKYKTDNQKEINNRDITNKLKPDSNLITLNDDYYYSHLIV
jgi:hypothetical protein